MYDNRWALAVCPAISHQNSPSSPDQSYTLCTANDNAQFLWFFPLSISQTVQLPLNMTITYSGNNDIMLESQFQIKNENRKRHQKTTEHKCSPPPKRHCDSECSTGAGVCTADLFQFKKHLTYNQLSGYSFILRLKLTGREIITKYCICSHKLSFIQGK